MYYDTPYDRHVILEESHDVRYRKRNSSKGLEDPAGFGSRILRRLSSKTKDTANNERSGVTGVVNRGFQMDVPKSPWRYPFRRSDQVMLQRQISQDSMSSVASQGAGPAGLPPIPMHKMALSRMLP